MAKVLVIDSDGEQAERARSFLDAFGFPAEVVVDSDAAIEVLQCHRVPVVVVAAADAGPGTVDAVRGAGAHTVIVAGGDDVPESHVCRAVSRPYQQVELIHAMCAVAGWRSPV